MTDFLAKPLRKAALVSALLAALPDGLGQQAPPLVPENRYGILPDSALVEAIS
jgi:hypothetical protein